MTKALLDTNILVYAVNQESEFCVQTKQFLEDLVQKEVTIYIPDKALYEFYRVLSSPAFRPYLSQKKAKQVWESFAFSEFFEIIYSDEIILKTTNKLLDKFPDSHIFDLQIMACGLVYKVDKIYTKNTKDFPKINETEVTDPTKLYRTSSLSL